MAAAGNLFVLPTFFIRITEEMTMAEKFDPAPHDKHAVGVKEAAREDRRAHEFPASDPVSATQPDKSKHDSDQSSSLWDKITGVFKS
jgi:hypothetical protein